MVLSDYSRKGLLSKQVFLHGSPIFHVRRAVDQSGSLSVPEHKQLPTLPPPESEPHRRTSADRPAAPQTAAPAASASRPARTRSRFPPPPPPAPLPGRAPIRAHAPSARRAPAV